MYNLRYHIVSIIAVFLALALGLVLGGLIGDKAPSTLQSNLASGINQQLTQIREDEALIKAQNSRLTDFGNDSITLLTKDQLKGRTILLIGAGTAASKQASQVLEGAGATVVTANIDAGHYKASDTNLASTKLVADLKAQYKQSDDLSALATGFAAEWSKATTTTAGDLAMTGTAARPVTAALQADGILKLTGQATTTSYFDGVVDVALGAKDAPDDFGLTLTQAFEHQGAPTIAAQTSETAATLGSAAAALNVSATDLLGTPMGSWTIVAVLNGAPPATYGTLSGAKQVYPPIK